MITSNHIHLIVVDDDSKDVISKSMQLVAGRTAQEYNWRKNRKGVEAVTITNSVSSRRLKALIFYLKTHR